MLAFVEEDFFPLQPLQLPFMEDLDFPQDAFALDFEDIASAPASIFTAFFLPNIVSLLKIQGESPCNYILVILVENIHEKRRKLKFA